jgi:hypothetical protein
MKDMIASNKLVYERQESSCLLRRKIFCLAAMSGWRFISVFQKLPVWQRLHDSSWMLFKVEYLHSNEKRYGKFEI